MPYRTQDTGIEGVVLTFADITERKNISDALEIAKLASRKQANIAKSRFCAAAGVTIYANLCKRWPCSRRLVGERRGTEGAKLVARLDETLGAISDMLNTLLDINQIDAGTIKAEPINFPINDLFDRLKDEFTYHAQSLHLEFRVVACGLSIHSDPRLLEQMLRNLLSNALKYTKRGKVLLGVRRRNGKLLIKILDTGVGIPSSELQAIFEEYHQIDNAARERSRGLGLGLSIVQRLGNLLGHAVRVRSFPGKGSIFSIEKVTLAPNGAVQPIKHRPRDIEAPIVATTPGTPHRRCPGRRR